MRQSWLKKLFRNSPDDTFERLLVDAKGGAAQSQFDLGLSLFNRSDFEQAAHWYLEAANQDHAGAQFALGVMFADGSGVARDETKALLWTTKAAQQAYPMAQHALGLRCRYSSFKETPQAAIESTLEAYKWFRLASAQGHRKAEAEFECLAVSMTWEQVMEGNRRVATFVAST